MQPEERVGVYAARPRMRLSARSLSTALHGCTHALARCPHRGSLKNLQRNQKLCKSYTNCVVLGRNVSRERLGQHRTTDRQHRIRHHKRSAEDPLSPHMCSSILLEGDQQGSPTQRGHT